MKSKLVKYELFTTESVIDMPFYIFARNRKAALNKIRRTLHKGERIISLKKDVWKTKRKFVWKSKG